MTTEKNENSFPRLLKWSYLANIVVAVTAILGLIYVYFQLNLFQEQTDTLNKSLIQSYRPLGFIFYNDPEGKGRHVIEYLNEGKKEKLSFIFRPSMVNKGSGVLVNIGHIYYITTEAINFRQKLLNRDSVIDDIHFDWRYNYTRRDAVLPSDKIEVSVRLDEIEFESQYYLYIMAFYEDQDGQLYDTVSKTVMNFGETYWETERMRTKFESALTTNQFNKYDETEKLKLIEMFKEKKHPIVDYFTM